MAEYYGASHYIRVTNFTGSSSNLKFYQDPIWSFSKSFTNNGNKIAVRYHCHDVRTVDSFDSIPLFTIYILRMNQDPTTPETSTDTTTQDRRDGGSKWHGRFSKHCLFDASSFCSHNYHLSMVSNKPETKHDIIYSNYYQNTK